jgi:hypothetical protein
MKTNSETTQRTLTLISTPRNFPSDFSNIVYKISLRLHLNFKFKEYTEGSKNKDFLQPIKYDQIYKPCLMVPNTF